MRVHTKALFSSRLSRALLAPTPPGDAPPPTRQQHPLLYTHTHTHTHTKPNAEALERKDLDAALRERYPGCRPNGYPDVVHLELAPGSGERG